MKSSPARNEKIPTAAEIRNMFAIPRECHKTNHSLSGMSGFNFPVPSYRSTRTREGTMRKKLVERNFDDETTVYHVILVPEAPKVKKARIEIDPELEGILDSLVEGEG